MSNAVGLVLVLVFVIFDVFLFLNNVSSVVMLIAFLLRLRLGDFASKDRKTKAAENWHPGIKIRTRAICRGSLPLMIRQKMHDMLGSFSAQAHLAEDAGATRCKRSSDVKEVPIESQPRTYQGVWG